MTVILAPASTLHFVMVTLDYSAVSNVLRYSDSGKYTYRTAFVIIPKHCNLQTYCVGLSYDFNDRQLLCLYYNLRQLAVNSLQPTTHLQLTVTIVCTYTNNIFNAL
jgi:hypothetical protein